MQVEIWWDIMCPFCYIGKTRFEAALKQFPKRESVTVIYRSYELDPRAERDIDQDVHDMLAAKYGMSREQAKSMNDNVAQMAKEVGLAFDFDGMVLTNTFDAHRMIHWASTQGKQAEMADRLFQAYFTEAKHVGEPAQLAALAGEIGLDAEAAAAMLAGSDFADAVRADEHAAQQLGVRGVPFFLLNRKLAVTGAQSVDVFLDALQQSSGEA
ncbi:DsbA family oxidoreductase [Xylanibacillus composti]|nr:DsbA family oxidoreductase [Xylanibacillus composti]